MKLKKREITLNEADSLKDAFYLEKGLQSEYLRGEGNAFRKEVVNEIEELRRQSDEDARLLFSLWKKSQAERL